jgi:ABC-type transporter Mla subunit MlaD
MRNFLQHKWVIGAGALILVLALGAVAWAATGDTTTTTPTVTPQQSAGPDGDGPDGMGFGLFGGGMMRHGKGGPGAAADPEQFQQDKEQRQQDMQARRDAFLKLIRDKMTPEDQQKLDSLSATAKQQQDALQAAREALGKTASEMRALVDKYFPEGAAPDSGTAPTTPGATSTTPSATTN